MERKKFSREFKLEAVNLARNGVFHSPRQPGTRFTASSLNSRLLSSI